MEKLNLLHFNSMAKTVINHRFKLQSSFQDILYLIDVWIGSGWNFESVESQYINISTYRPLSGISYMDLPAELRSPKKDQKKKNQKYFLWCHARHINPSKEHPERILKND